MQELVENQVNDEELEEVYGGSGSCTVDLSCGFKIYSDEDNEENIVF